MYCDHCNKNRNLLLYVPSQHAPWQCYCNRCGHVKFAPNCNPQPVEQKDLMRETAMPHSGNP